jgi:hypothetical protein
MAGLRVGAKPVSEIRQRTQRPSSQRKMDGQSESFAHWRGPGPYESLLCGTWTGDPFSSTARKQSPLNAPARFAQTKPSGQVRSLPHVRRSAPSTFPIGTFERPGAQVSLLPDAHPRAKSVLPAIAMMNRSTQSM